MNTITLKKRMGQLLIYDFFGLPEGHPDKRGEGVVSSIDITICRFSDDLLIRYFIKEKDKEDYTSIPSSCVVKFLKTPKRTKNE